MFNLPQGEGGIARLFEQAHPAYDWLKDDWTLLLDALDGDGQFRDGGYLWKFPREYDGEFQKRKAQARYHNYAETLVGFYVRKIMAGVTRETSNAELEAWWADIDGAGTPIHDFLSAALTKALGVGHVGVLVDKTQDAPTGPARTDERARVFLTPYLPTAIQDWRLHRDKSILAVKLREAVPQDDLLAEPLAEDDAIRMLLWDADEWVRITRKGEVQRVPNPIGAVPMVVIAPLPSARWPLVGRSILGDGSLIRALYNRQSEEDDVLRNQAFSIFVVSMPSDVEDVEKVKSEMGNETGTTRALFVRGTGSYETPDMGVPAQIRENEAYLIRELYRLAHVPYDNDARDAESAEAKRADWEEITGILRGVAAEMHRAELALARLWCAWQTATSDAADRLFESAKVTVTYPRDYFEENPTDKMALHMEALKLEIGPTWDAVVKKDAVRWLKPTLDQPTLDKVDAEIDARKGVPEPMLDPVQLRAQAQGRMRAALAEDDAA